MSVERMTVVYGEAASHLFWEDLGGVLRLHLLPQRPCAASSASPEDLILARSPEYSLTNHRTHSWTYSHVQCASEIQLPIEFSCLPSDLFMPPYLPTCTGSSRKQKHSRKTSISDLLRTIDWFQIGKGVHQGCILSPCLVNLYAEYIMRNAGLDEAQAGIKIAGRNIKNLRYADDITLMAESEEELNSLLVKVKKESEKVGLKLNITSKFSSNKGTQP